MYFQHWTEGVIKQLNPSNLPVAKMSSSAGALLAFAFVSVFALVELFTDEDPNKSSSSSTLGFCFAAVEAVSFFFVDEEKMSSSMSFLSMISVKPLDLDLVEDVEKMSSSSSRAEGFGSLVAALGFSLDLGLVGFDSDDDAKRSSSSSRNEDGGAGFFASVSLLLAVLLDENKSSAGGVDLAAFLVEAEEEENTPEANRSSPPAASAAGFEPAVFDFDGPWSRLDPPSRRSSFPNISMDDLLELSVFEVKMGEGDASFSFTGGTAGEETVAAGTSMGGKSGISGTSSRAGAVGEVGVASSKLIPVVAAARRRALRL